MRIKTILKNINTIIKQPYYKLHRSKVHYTSYLRDASGVIHTRIGRYCWINRRVDMNHVNMGNYCSVATDVLIGGMEHSINHISTSTKLSDSCISNKTTRIGNDVWIGAQCVIKQGVTIGDGAVIGAKSFVNKDVPPYAVVVGSPAKVIRFRFDQTLIEKISSSKYWELPPNKARVIINMIESKHSF